MSKMNIEWVSINEITPYTRNAKKHPKSQIEKIAKSIQQFGWKQNLVIDGSGVLVVGHGRYEAAKLLGLKEVPCVRADDLTEDEIRAYRLADNAVSGDDYDTELIIEELKEIEYDMSEFDFSIGRGVARFDRQSVRTTGDKALDARREVREFMESVHAKERDTIAKRAQQAMTTAMSTALANGSLEFTVNGATYRRKSKRSRSFERVYG